MALPWLQMLEALDEAAFHVQVHVESVARVDQFQATVAGTVARVFKGDRGVMGARVGFSLPCAGVAGEPGPPGLPHSPLPVLQGTSVMEVFFETLSADAPSPAQPSPVHAHFLSLDEPTEEPAFDLQAELAGAREVAGTRAVARREREASHLKRVGAFASVGAYFLALVLLATWLSDDANSPRGPAWWGWLILAPALLLPELLNRRRAQPFSWPWWFLAVLWTLTLVNEGLLHIAPG